MKTFLVVKQTHCVVGVVFKTTEQRHCQKKVPFNYIYISFKTSWIKDALFIIQLNHYVIMYRNNTKYKFMNSVSYPVLCMINLERGNDKANWHGGWQLECSNV